MEDQLKVRTSRLLTDYLEHCARRPGSAPRPPSSLEAEVLRSLGARVQERYGLSWTRYRRCPGDRVETVATAMQDVFQDPEGPNWGRVVALVTFAGFLLERPPASNEGALAEWDASVDQDCQSLVTLLCACLTEQHRAWLEAQGGWDGFCHFFGATRSRWRKVLVPFLLSCLTLIVITYLCRNRVARFLTHFYLPTCDQPSECEMRRNSSVKRLLRLFCLRPYEESCGASSAGALTPDKDSKVR